MARGHSEGPELGVAGHKRTHAPLYPLYVPPYGLSPES